MWIHKGGSHLIYLHVACSHIACMQSQFSNDKLVLLQFNNQLSTVYNFSSVFESYIYLSNFHVKSTWVHDANGLEIHCMYDMLTFSVSLLFEYSLP